jgi:hypothetical protein
MIALRFSSLIRSCIALMLVALSSSTAISAPMTFNFSGIVEDNTERWLYLGKSIGDHYSGTFTVDPGASVADDYGDIRTYEGSYFGVTVEGVLYPVERFTVWPTGVEFMLVVGNNGAFLSLRSVAPIYSSPDVPTSYNINDFDDLSQVAVFDFGGGWDEDRGSILAISAPAPEPNACAMLIAGIAAFSHARSRRRS